MKPFKLLLILIASIFISCNNKENQILEPSEEPVWTVSGPLLFISNKSGTNQLYSMKIDGSDAKQLTNDPDFPITSAKYSPDGKKIVLTSPNNIDLHGSKIYIVNNDGTNKYKIANDPKDGIHYGTGHNPSWAYDSKSIVFFRIIYPESIGNTDIYTINIDGTNEQRITTTHTLSEMWPSFSNDNSKILTTVIHWNAKDSSGQSIQHYTTNEYDLEGNQLTEYGIEGEGWTAAIYSFDFSKTSFTLYDSDGLCKICTMNIDGTNLITLAESNTQQYRTVSWTSENKIIYCETSGNSFNRIFVMNSDGSDKQEITPFETEILEATNFNSHY